jgi:nucleotide-binding universal stress UspA family protein
LNALQRIDLSAVGGDPMKPPGIKTILCAIDFSHYSRRVLHYAVELAAAHNAFLTVFHAVSFPRSPLYGTVAGGATATYQAAIQQARQQITRLMAEYPVQWQAEVRHGDPVDEILALCQSRPVDLVITASHGLTGLRRMLLGSVVEQLAHVMSRPLLIVRSKNMHKRKKPASSLKTGQILVGCRPGAQSGGVVRGALELVPKPVAQYHFVHALEAPVDEQIIDPSTGPYNQVQQDLQNRIIRQIEADLAPYQIPPENRTIQIVNGHPGEQLAMYADTHRVDLVVIGVRPRKTLSRRLIGSTADALMRHAPCPVLTVPGAHTAS